MEDGGLGVRINRQSSIESEPRTLTFDQIHYAREAALYVVNTRGVEEALSVFTEKKIGRKVFVNRLTENKISGILHYQGLEPVDSVAPKGGSTMHLDVEINSIRPQLIKLPAELRDWRSEQREYGWWELWQTLDSLYPCHKDRDLWNLYHFIS